jgi:FkbM family methyltransferase
VTSVAIHRTLHRIGLDLVRYPGSTTVLGRRLRLLRHYGVDLVLDVGANVGQYGALLRAIGYRGHIVSFEPLPDAYAELARVAGQDRAWEVVNVALGAASGEAALHTAANSVSSSFLPMLPEHARAAPESVYVADVIVPVRTLDEVYDQYASADERVFLKVDAQGYEAQVLAGAARSLERIVGLQLEMSIVPLFEGSPTLPELITSVAGLGFTLMGIEPGFTDWSSGRLLQADGIFFRASSTRAAAS